MFSLNGANSLAGKVLRRTALLDVGLVAGQLSLLNFAVAAILSFHGLHKHKKSAVTSAKVGFALFIIATISVTCSLGANLYAGRLSLVESRSLVLACALAVLALVAHFGLSMTRICAPVAPVTAGLMLTHLIQTSMGRNLDLAEFSGYFLSFHVAGAVMGQILAVGAGIVSILYLWQQRVLKRKLLDQLTAKVPALDILEKILISSLWAGLLFLTTALVSGALFVHWHPGKEGAAQTEKFIWAATVWIWYLSILLGRKLLGISAKRLAQMSLVGLIFLMVTFFGLSFL